MLRALDGVARRLEQHVALCVAVDDAEVVVVRARQHVPAASQCGGVDLRVIAAEARLELVEDAIALVEIAQLWPKVLVHLQSGRLHKSKDDETHSGLVTP